jgi:tRNA G10  N-methylase Trm11
MRHFLVFGTHPRLALAELKALRPGLDKPFLAGPAAMVDDPDWDGAVLMAKLGGTVKLGDIVGTLPTEDCTTDAVADLLADRLGTSSIDFGWTVYGGSKGVAQRLSKLALPFKKALKAKSISSRWVTGEHGSTISPAAVAKLKLTTQGLDVCLFPMEGQVCVGLTTDVQDADAWSQRDYGRPARDDVNGMLPPKLARMMVNLAQVPHRGTVLDPFCGGGTVCMEAVLATNAAKVIGSDLEDKQISDARRNQEWLIKQGIFHPGDGERCSLFQADVRQVGSHLSVGSVDRVVTEGYLGPPLHGHERQADIEKNAAAVTDLWRDALEALFPVLRPGARLVCVWPGYRTSKGMAHVDLGADLPNLGYTLENPLEGWEQTGGPIIYQRPGQHVNRRIVVLRKAA